MFDKIRTDELERLNSVFKNAGFEIRLVGGAVRDLLLFQSPKDIDLCTDATPDEMIELAKTNGIQLIPTGLQHGTVTFVINKEHFEVTTLRADVDTDGRHATVEFVRSFEEDAARRDLTFNAMSMDFDGNVYDYFGGEEDLRNGRVRFVGDAGVRVREDYLRILRFFRFFTRFGNTPLDNFIFTNESYVISTNVKGLTQISGERIWSEIGKILSLPGAGTTLQAMRFTNVMRTIGMPWSCSSVEFVNHSDDAVTNLATLVYGDEELAVLKDRWKISSKELSSVGYLLGKGLVHLTSKRYDFDTMLGWLVDGDKKEDVLRLARYQDFLFASEDANRLESAEVPVFPVTGKDLLDLGFKPGKEFGQKLAELKSVWKESKYRLVKSDLLVKLK